MAVDALLPVGGELVMLYAGVVPAGAAAGPAAFLGATLATGAETYLVLAAAGTLGYLAGALVGWLIGVRGGRPLVERHGHWLHLSPRTLDRAERWFARHGDRAVLLRPVHPVIPPFIFIPPRA